MRLVLYYEFQEVRIVCKQEKKRGFSFKSFFIAFRSSLPIHESKISMNSDTKAFQGDAYNGSEWVADDQAPLVTRKSMTRATTKTNTRYEIPNIRALKQLSSYISNFYIFLGVFPNMFLTEIKITLSAFDWGIILILLIRTDNVPISE